MGDKNYMKLLIGLLSAYHIILYYAFERPAVVSFSKIGLNAR